MVKNLLERDVENYLVAEVEKRGGLCEKHTSPGRRGPPDRLITLPKHERWISAKQFMRRPACMDLAELKRPKNGRLSPSQKRDHARRAKLGIRVWVLWTKEHVDEYIRAAFP